MTSGINVKQRDIILVPFPYSDLSQTKKRPAIVISNDKHNNTDDIICCAITSNPRNYANSVKINSKDIVSGKLMYESRVKPNKLFTLDKRRIIKVMGRANLNKSREIVENLNSVVAIEE